MPITVVVKKSTTGAEGRALFEQTGLRCDIRKGAVTIVPIQAVLAEVCDEEIFVAVVVVVSDADAVGPSRVMQACLFGDVGEATVAVVVIETIARTGGNTVEAAAAEDEDVHPPVVVVVKEGTTRAHDFDDVGGVTYLSKDHGLGEARARGSIDKSREWRDRLGGWHHGLKGMCEDCWRDCSRSGPQQPSPCPVARLHGCHLCEMSPGL